MLTTGDTTVIARTSARVVVPIVLLTSLSLLFQGHILPGGGFIGGVLTATAFALVYIVYGLDYVRNALLDVPATRVETADPEERSGPYRTTFAVGLGIAAGSGLVAVFLGYPFLTQAVYFFEGLPLYGDFEVASAFAFDLGVYLVVVGGLLTILREVGEE
ncbi:sodium:proton antiporter [Halobacteriales archaeon QS_8_69_26]|nr:MAG: sodium:proton antiporter [Halobacteriales archaeon QS_8_69_26]